MSILIKNMEMPTACCACPCSYDNICAVINKRPTFTEWYESKPDWCPLIELPAQHGRLIEADRIELYMQDEWMNNELSNGDWILFRERLKEVPTVLPSDKDGAE